VTGPLAQQFARLREFRALIKEHMGMDDVDYFDDSVSAIERHVQDMEKERDFEQRRYINSFNENRALIRELRTLKDSVEAAGGE